MKTNGTLKQSRRRFLQTARAKDFDNGAPICGKPRTAAEVRRLLGISS